MRDPPQKKTRMKSSTKISGEEKTHFAASIKPYVFFRQMIG
jgi:hypothetical protein